MSEAPAILAEGLVKTYGTTTALAGLDLAVPAGTVYGLLGPNGAGKTTAVRVFSTLLRPNRGRAQVLGHDVVTEAAQVRRMIGLTGQYAALDEYLTGRANLVIIGQLSRLTSNAQSSATRPRSCRRSSCRSPRAPRWASSGPTARARRRCSSRCSA